MRARDPFIDLIRVFSIILVVGQHWMMPVLRVDGGTLYAGNSLSTPGWWVLTWVGQVMPVVFFAGGAANLHSWRRAKDTRTWLIARARRLALPVVPLVAVWVPLPHLLIALGVPDQPVRLASGIVGQLLWFLAVYLLAVALVPLSAAAHRRFGLWVLPVLGGAALLVDVARFNGVPVIGFINALFVWLGVHQLGIAYAEGQFDRLGRAAAAAIGVAGLAATGLLIAVGPYPASMVGIPGDPVSNMSPPTVVMLTFSIGLLGLVLAARPALLRLAQRPSVRGMLTVLGPRYMTMYLWHMPALVLLGGIATFGFGYATPAPGSLAWLVQLPVVLGALALVMVPICLVFQRFEAMTGGPALPMRTPRLAAGIVLLSTGLLGLSAIGFVPPTHPGGLWLLISGSVPWASAMLLGVLLTSNVRFGELAVNGLDRFVHTVFAPR